MNSLSVFFPSQNESWHSNIMADKGLKLFDECAAEYVHPCPQEHKSASSSWGRVECTHLTP